MFSSLRLAPLACLLLGALAGCPSEPNTKICAGTGILCPQDMYCGAVQPICLTTACGNGLIDPGEECDDGNVLPGDSCSPICRKEQCGNNVLDPNEICDDGNTQNGDGCNSSCTSKEVCGNGIKDVGEACDDGKSAQDPNATKNADGCSGTPVTVGGEMSPAPCKSTEVCGNGIKDIQVGEVCDDGNTASGDGCNSDCRSGEGCGNGILDPGEQCDDGNANNQDDCLNTCKNAKCGDGVVDNMGTHGEQCDPSTSGNPTETATCNIDCTTRACGDAKVNQTAGEQCDNGISGNGDTKNCTAGCLLNICGDGKVDMQPPGLEQCDDGNTNNTDGCSNACQLASCGNSTVDMGEQCDDGNTDDTDACVMCHTAICGDGKVRAGTEQCDDGNNANGDGCSASCKNEVCGNSILDVNEECDDGNASNTDACTTSCAIAVCGDGFIRAGVEQCDDGNTMSNDGCSSTCRNEGCGNGILDQGEQCDDGNMNSGDGCSSTCTFEACGDGFINNGEQCDGNGTGVGGETANCNADCTTASCGDGKTNATRGEQCDAGPGKNADNRDCTAMCKVNICTDGLRDTLGPTHFEACDDGNTIPTDGCNNSCTLASCGNGLLDPGEQCDDNNNVSTDSCVNCQNAICGDGVVRTGVEECDGTPNCSATCHIQVCGNGIIDPGEKCDDGNLNNGDGCSGNLPVPHPTLQKCQFEFCGDGLKGTSELCDKSVSGMAALCNRDCTPSSCGDGKLNVDANEECDDGVVGANPATTMVSGDGCSATCKLERCGNSITDTAAGEQCDPPNPGGGCSTLCRNEVCGNGIKDVGEQCDDGNNSDTDACVSNSTTPANCKIAVCGDMHTRTGVEDCDHGAMNGTMGDTCSATCHTVMCGNGFKEQGEACDDGNQANGDGCNSTCTKVEKCGDGLPDFGEECDVDMNNSPTSTTFTGTCFPGCRTNKCGDGHPAGTEACDFGQANTNATRCPYGQTSCMLCSTTCTLSTGTTGGVCGDNVPNTTPATMSNPPGPEMCDDGNTITETNCPYGTATCTGCTNLCQPTSMLSGPICGDGVQNGPSGVEQCDDGAPDAIPGNDPDNTNDPFCPYGMSSCPAKCNTGCHTLASIGRSCGDSVVNTPNETCDTGGSNGTVCTATYNGACTYCGDGTNGVACQVTVVVGPHCGDGVCNAGNGETLASCPGDCQCGNGTKQGTEACDDGNNTAGDGCSPSCTVETGFTCSGSMPSSCTAICGDGLVRGTETCDDSCGPTVPGTCNASDDGDGCSQTCGTETGWECTGMPSTCHLSCGDGDIDGTEACDPNNAMPAMPNMNGKTCADAPGGPFTMGSPACSATCTVTVGTCS